MMAFSCSRQVIIHPKRKDIIETVYASGKIISNNEYNVYALSSGTVVKKLVKEGDVVTQNQVLYVIKNDAPAIRLEAAQTNYKLAQANLSSQSFILNDLKLSVENAQTKLSNDSSTYFHLKTLWDENIGSKNNLDAAYTQYIISKNQLKSALEKYYSTLNDLNLALHSAQSQLTDAQTNLNNYFIKSESNGTVFQTYKELGESVKPNDVIALVGESSNRIIKLAVDQEDIDKIKTVSRFC
jgi:multidrug efflux pump subunit AcrA (membrane-fusion protein)